MVVQKLALVAVAALVALHCSDPKARRGPGQIRCIRSFCDGFTRFGDAQSNGKGGEGWDYTYTPAACPTLVVAAVAAFTLFASEPGICHCTCFSLLHQKRPEFHERVVAVFVQLFQGNVPAPNEKGTLPGMLYDASRRCFKFRYPIRSASSARHAPGMSPEAF